MAPEPQTKQSMKKDWLGLIQLGWALFSRSLLAPFYALYKNYLQRQAKHWKIPGHIGIIMDGNRRFARGNQMKSVLSGHSKGAEKLEEVLNWAEEVGIHVVTVWVFSLDNFNRSPEEVDGLMDLFEKKFLDLVSDERVHRDQIRVCSLGKIDALPQRVQEAIKKAEKATAHYSRRFLNISVAYGGREEIVDAFKSFLSHPENQKLTPAQLAKNLKPEDIEPFLYTAHVPDPELIIRTSGEIRLSGFLLWQSAYSEFYFCDTHWPAFRKIDFLRALRDYHFRQRRFGR